MLLGVSTGAVLLGLGALLSGVASLVTALAGIRRVRRQAVDECDKRIAQLNQAFERGMKVQPRELGDEERWSHLP